MREIKFRAWETDKNEMCKVNFMNFNDYEVGVQDSECGTYRSAGYYKAYLMQYTGIKDINGKEVYEGDIVIPWWNIDGCEELCMELEQGVVVWDKNECCFTITGHEPNTVGTFDGVEVVGNIYENPDMVMENIHERD